MRNIEIKAFLRDPDFVKTKSLQLAGIEPAVIKQIDTFYVVPNGRLKLRVFENGDGSLIHYERSDIKGPKLSNYTITKFSGKPACDAINDVLSKANGILGVVEKTRLLYLVGQTRIHVDQVLHLGDFMELEVVLEDHQDMEVGEEICNNLMESLNIGEPDLISEAYIDLLLRNKNYNNNLKFIHK